MKNLFLNAASKISILIALLATLSCANNTDYQKIHDAQLCLDKATSGTASNCIAMVSGVTSAAASLIRCAGTFVIEGTFSASNLNTITSGLQGGGTPNSTAMNALAFNAATKTADAATVVTECAASGSAGLSLLGTFASIATTAAGLGGCSYPPSQSCITTNAATLAATPGVPAALSSAYTQNCSSSSSNNPYQAFCTQYAAAAAGGGTPASIASSFLNGLK